MFKQYNLTTHQFSRLSYLINIELGVRPKEDYEEVDAILNVLNGYSDLYEFAVNHMLEISEFYLLNKKFWEEWRSLVGF